MSLTTADRQYIELRIRNDAPNIAVAYVLWGVLGILSAHRFYLGRPRSAVFQIISYPVIFGVSWLAISTALSAGIIRFEGMQYFAVVFAIFWWLLDAALISGIIRDDKEAMRERLTRELEGGAVVAAPAPIRDVRPEKPPVQKAAPAKAVALQAIDDKTDKSLATSPAALKTPETRTTPAEPLTPAIASTSALPDVPAPAVTAPLSTITQVEPAVSAASSLVETNWTPAPEHAAPPTPIPPAVSTAEPTGSEPWAPAPSATGAVEPPVMLPYPHRPLPDR